MNPSYIRVAASKTSNMEALELLRSIEETAQALQAVQLALPGRIRAQKEARGEAATALRESDRTKLSAIDRDLTESHAMMERELLKLTSAHAVIWALHRALTNNMASSKRALQHWHPDDLWLGTEVQEAKGRLAASMTQFLERFPRNTDAVRRRGPEPRWQHA